MSQTEIPAGESVSGIRLMAWTDGLDIGRIQHLRAGSISIGAWGAAGVSQGRD